MAEYIEREALRDTLYDADAITMNGVKILNQFPCADVAPVRHGRWISKNHHGYEWVFVCSNCDYIDGYPFNDRPNYCPNCGARMDEPIEENDK